MELNTSYIGTPNIVTILSVEPSKDGRSWGKYRLDTGKLVYTGQTYYAVNESFIEKAREIRARKDAAEAAFNKEWRALCEAEGTLVRLKEGGQGTLGFPPPQDGQYLRTASWEELMDAGINPSFIRMARHWTPASEILRFTQLKRK